MSIRMFEIEVPTVVVREVDSDRLTERHRMVVRITMGPNATAKDAVDALAAKLEETCNTIDIGDDE